MIAAISKYFFDKKKEQQKKKRDFETTRDEFNNLTACFSETLSSLLLNINSPSKAANILIAVRADYYQKIIPLFFKYCQTADKNDFYIKSFLDGDFKIFFKETVPNFIRLNNTEQLLYITKSYKISHSEGYFSFAKDILCKNTMFFSLRRIKLLIAIKKCYKTY